MLEYEDREIQAIAEQLAQYAHRFDSHDIEGWVALFTDDAIFEVKLPDSDTALVRLEGAEQLRAFASGSPAVLHHIGSLVFDELLEDSARARAVVLGTWTSPTNGEPAIFTHGTYELRWSKIQHRWRLAHVLFRSRGYTNAMQTPSRAAQ
jgi:hypothetical protein